MKLYELTLISIGALGGTTSALLLRGGYETALSLSLGANVALFVGAYALHEDWHRLNEVSD